MKRVQVTPAEMTFGTASVIQTQRSHRIARVSVTPASFTVTSQPQFYTYGPTFQLVYYPGAQQASIEVVRTDPSSQVVVPRPQRGGGRRGKASPVFNASQRRSMRSKLSKLRINEPAYFLTLKYPADYTAFPGLGFPTNPDVYGAHRHNLLRRIESKYPKVAAIWRLEFTRFTGAPHFHVLLYNLPGADQLQSLREQVAAMWFDVTGLQVPEHLETCTHLKPVAAIRSALEYMAKRDRHQLTSRHIVHEGRSWGEFGRDRLPLAVPQTRKLKPAHARQMERTMRKYRNKTSNRTIAHYPGDTLRLRRGDADAWARYETYLREHD